MPRRVIIRGLVIVSLLLVIGTAFYMSVEKLSLVDAFYLSGTTLTTLGYGDITPQTDLAKVFTVIYTLLGIGTIFYVSGQLLHVLFTKPWFDVRFHKLHKMHRQSASSRKTRKRKRR